MSREDREHFLAGTGWDFGVPKVVPGLLMLLLQSTHIPPPQGP